MIKMGNLNLILFLIFFNIFVLLFGVVYDPNTVYEGFDFFMIFKAIGSLFTGMFQLGKIFLYFLKAVANFPLLIEFILDILFRFIPEVAFWIVPFFICTFTKIMLIPRCGIWYALDIFFYLFLTVLLFIFWLIDTITMMDITSILYFIFDLLEELDENLHHVTSMHIIHYPDSVIETCYSCDTLPFPEVPVWPF